MNCVADDDDDIDNAKSPPKCENLIGDFDDITDEYYEVKGTYGLIYNRSDEVNPPPLSPESPAYTMNIPCICSSIPNDGERIVLPSSVSRVVKENTVMKGYEDSREADSDVAYVEKPFFQQDEEGHSVMNDNTNSVNGNVEMVEGSKIQF